MKKKLMWLFIVVVIISANVFYFAKPTPVKKTDLKLASIQLRADDPVEIDPPGDEFPPTIPSRL